MENVRMGELALSAKAGDQLVAIGLGSCIGLAVVDRDAGVAGLAHVVLPDSQGKPGPAAKFADLAVPEIVSSLERLGARKQRMQAVLIGGASMFATAGSLDIGARNSDAVRSALRQAGIRIYTEEIGGKRGRTARVVLGGDISSQEAGGTRISLLSLASPGSTRTRADVTVHNRSRRPQATSAARP